MMPEPRTPESSNSMNLPLVFPELSANLKVWLSVELEIVSVPRLSSFTWYVPVNATFVSGPDLLFTSSVPPVTFPFPSAMKDPAA